MMLFERARWPPNERPEVEVAPCCGVRSVVTPGVMTEKLDEVAAVDRQALDLPASDDGGDRRLARVHHRSITGHRDRVLQARDLHRDVEHRGLAEQQRDPAADLAGESGPFDCEVIDARREGRRLEPAAPVGHDRARDVRLGVDNGDLGAGKPRPGFVLDMPFEIGARQPGLRLAHGGEQQQQEQAPQRHRDLRTGRAASRFLV